MYNISYEVIIMAIRKYKSTDYEQVVNVCLDTCDPILKQKPLNRYIKRMFCDYYIQNEPENCFVLTDENDSAVGYVYGASNYGNYHKKMGEYLKDIAEIEGGKYLPDAYTEMYDHYIYENEYPAHLHIDIFEQYRGNGNGSQLIKEFCRNMREQGITGVMLIVGADNVRAQKFYEKNGFKLLKKKKSGFTYGIKL